MNSAETVKMLKKEKSISQVMDMFDKVDIAINGIARFTPKSLPSLPNPIISLRMKLLCSKNTM